MFDDMPWYLKVCIFLTFAFSLLVMGIDIACVVRWILNIV